MFVQGQDKSNLNPYPVLPPISSPHLQIAQPKLQYQQQQSAQPQHNSAQPQQQQQQYRQMTPSIDHIIPESNSAPLLKQTSRDATPFGNHNDNYLPRNPIYLNPQEEQSLMIDTNRELKSYTSEQLKNFYSELTSYDPTLSGFTHYNYVTLVAMRNRFPISESLLRFLMSRYVSLNKEKGCVNYEELVKFLARCLSTPNANQQQQKSQNMGRMPDTFDPDEQAILRLMHENMREWDQVNLIDCDNLRRKFYDIDPYNRYIIPQREVILT